MQNIINKYINPGLKIPGLFFYLIILFIITNNLAACHAGKLLTNSLSGNENGLNYQEPKNQIILLEELLKEHDNPEIMRKENYPASKSAEIYQIISGNLSTEITNKDKNYFAALHLLLKAYVSLSEKKIDPALSFATMVLNKENLSPTFYKTALSIYIIADLAANDNKKSNQLSFNDLQLKHCRVFCDSPGWSTLAKYNLLTQQKYFSDILGNKILATIYQQLIPEYQTLFKAKFSSQADEQSDINSILQANTAMKLQQLVKENKLSFALKIANRISEKYANAPNLECNGELIYALYIKALSAKYNQQRTQYFKLLDQVNTEITKKKCQAKDFSLNLSAFLFFKHEIQLWLARLNWEQGNLAAGKKICEEVINEATLNDHLDTVFSSVQILVGRIGYENLTPKENIALLEKYYSQLAKFSQESNIWFNSRLGLFSYLEGNHLKAIEYFTKITQPEFDKNTRAFANYWLGRANNALLKSINTSEYFNDIAKSDPLSIYDIFAGQFMKRESGLISSAKLTPFSKPWPLEIREKFDIKTNSFPIFFDTISTNNASLDKIEVEIYETSLRNSIFLSIILRTIYSDLSFEKFNYALNSSDLFLAEFLKKEVNFTRHEYLSNYLNDENFNKSATNIAWLEYIIGDYLNGILLVSKLKDYIPFEGDEYSFLYFMFYPKPYREIIEDAAAKCAIDADLLWAIGRQESLFQVNAVSAAGAVGLFQLMPSTAKNILNKFPEYQNKSINLFDVKTNALAGACYISDLLKRYNGNIVFTIAAYNAGENMVDVWRKERNKLGDLPMFIEFIPYGETKTYTQRVLRNYYNMKWIYR